MKRRRRRYKILEFKLNYFTSISGSNSRGTGKMKKKKKKKKERNKEETKCEDIIYPRITRLR